MITPRAVLLVCLACVLHSGAAFAQNPYTLRCDSLDTHAYRMMTIRVGVDSLFNPVRDLSGKDFIIRETGYGYIPTLLTGSCSHDSLSVMLVIDQSLSMNGNDMGGGKSRIAAAKDAATRFVTRLSIPPDEAALITFSSQATVARNWTKNSAAMLQTISNVALVGATNLTAPAQLALSMLANRPGKRVLLFMTDGDESPQYRTFNGALQGLLDSARKNSIRVFSIGMYPSAGADRNGGGAKLKAFAEGAGGKYYLAPNASQLLSIYDSIYVQLLRPTCTLEFYTPKCDSGPRELTITFHRGAYSLVDTEHFVAPAPSPTWCDCFPIAYRAVSLLDAVYPNPVNGGQRMSIPYHVENDGPVNISIYTMLGERIATPVNETQSAGSHEFSMDGAELPTGVYFIRALIGGHAQQRSFAVSH